jgi:hypothetical protein
MKLDIIGAQRYHKRVHNYIYTKYTAMKKVLMLLLILAPMVSVAQQTKQEKKMAKSFCKCMDTFLTFALDAYDEILKNPDVAEAKRAQLTEESAQMETCLSSIDGIKDAKVDAEKMMQQSCPKVLDKLNKLKSLAGEAEGTDN